jgi:hypothetical protein
MSRGDELQREVTRLSLVALSGTAFVLAGSGAIREHGIVDRPTEDVDLFTSDVSTGAFTRAVDSVQQALTGEGFTVVEARRADLFARLEVATADGRLIDIDMGVDWREADPAILEIGPVLSLGDAVGNKISALYSRAYPRDFLDADAIRRSGHFSDDELVAAALERDPGFEVAMFREQLLLVRRLTFSQVEQYGISEKQFHEIVERCEEWAERLG